MPTIVISAVNLVEGGTLKIFQDCLEAVKARLPGWRVVALVNNTGVIKADGIEAMVIPWAKISWFRRIYAEYVVFKRISKQLKPDIWWSLHDMSPRVSCKSQFVYCHNAIPFYRCTFKELRLEPKLLFFGIFYSLFYRLNIRSNRAVVVQQDWIRREFQRRYGVRNVIVAHPVEEGAPPALASRGPVSTFVYPSLPRAFKNFELIGDAARLLEREPDWNGEILLTFAKEENRLTRDFFKRYGDVKGLRLIGRQSRAQMDCVYAEMDCLLFPSRLETWGLPITETKSLGKPMILADLPYARESVGTYDGVRFVDPGNAHELADIMLDAHHHGWRSPPVENAPPAEPFARNWEELIDTVAGLHEQSCRHPAERSAQ